MDRALNWSSIYRGSPTSTVSTSTISTSTNFFVIGIKLVLVEFLWNCYVLKIVLMEIGYVVLISTNFAQYDFFKIPKIVLSKDPLYIYRIRNLIFSHLLQVSRFENKKLFNSVRNLQKPFFRLQLKLSIQSVLRNKGS